MKCWIITLLQWLLSCPPQILLTICIFTWQLAAVMFLGVFGYAKALLDDVARDPDHYNRIDKDDPSLQTMNITAIVGLCLGGLTMTIALLGYCGSCCNSRSVMVAVSFLSAIEKLRNIN